MPDRWIMCSVSRCRALARHHGPVPDQAIEHRSTDHPAVTTGAQLSVISAKPSTATAAQTSNPHSRPGAHRLPAGSFFGGFRTPALGSAARFNDRPASETLHESGPSQLRARMTRLRRFQPFARTRSIGSSRPKADRSAHGRRQRRARKDSTGIPADLASEDGEQNRPHVRHCLPVPDDFTQQSDYLRDIAAFPNQPWSRSRAEGIRRPDREGRMQAHQPASGAMLRFLAL
jgi:hypothetical protein